MSDDQNNPKSMIENKSDKQPGASFAPCPGSVTGVARKNRIRSRALQLLKVAGYIPKHRLKQALRIAATCEESH